MIVVAYEWQDDAACKGMDVGVFFPDTETLHNQKLREAKQAAVAICQRCPVETQCRQWALRNNEQWGILGGLTEEDRRQIRLRQSEQRNPPVCGTPGGYKQHRRYEETPCDACTHAHSRANAERLARQQQGAA